MGTLMDPNTEYSTASSEEDSSFSLELVVDKEKKVEKIAEAYKENNIYDFDLETMKDKPWLKPGADITDYFNYGFTEQTWMRYCEMQANNREFAKKYGKPQQRAPEKKNYYKKRKYSTGDDFKQHARR